MGQLHVFFFPFMAHGHMIPTLAMARLFASRGVKTTIITTPLNVSIFAKTIRRTKHLGNEIGLHLIKFPAAEVGLPEGYETIDHIPSDDMLWKFMNAVTMLQEPLEQVLKECHPNCLIADMMFPWATEAAAKFDIPRLVFHGTSYFALCAMASMKLYRPFKNISSDSEPIVVPNLPHEIKLTKEQISQEELEETEKPFTKLINQMTECELNSFGVVVNSFYELEPDYVAHYTKVLGRRAWHIGPLSLYNRDFDDQAEGGKKASIDEHECLEWLNSKKPSSVIYVSFGSIANFNAAQLYEVATGLEASGQQFIWVVRKGKHEEEESEKWLPEGFEERMKGKGLIIKGWAPQVLILDHESIGGFITHCGWNSTLEGVSAGVPMVTWPIFAEQFYNEKLVTEILRTGVTVGSKAWSRVGVDEVKRDTIENAVKRIMVGEEAGEMRSRSKALKEMARKAIEDDGSSYSDLNTLIEELSSYGS